eukprot:3974096-Pyramimonas_sp.AAC.1
MPYKSCGAVAPACKGLLMQRHQGAEELAGGGGVRAGGVWGGVPRAQEEDVVAPEVEAGGLGVLRQLLAGRERLQPPQHLATVWMLTTFKERLQPPQHLR